jgi:hypothetical protein
VLRRLAALRESDREEAEDCRLLYVAATRAKTSSLRRARQAQKDGTLSLGGWLERLGAVAGLTEMSINDDPLLHRRFSSIRRIIRCSPLCPSCPCQWRVGSRRRKASP